MTSVVMRNVGMTTVVMTNTVAPRLSKKKTAVKICFGILSPRGQSLGAASVQKNKIGSVHRIFFPGHPWLESAMQKVGSDPGPVLVRPPPTKKLKTKLHFRVNKLRLAPFNKMVCCWISEKIPKQLLPLGCLVV